MQHLVIVGGGFAGFWSAISAIRQTRELEKVDELKITLVAKDEFHSIRPRFYEESLDGLRIPLKKYCDPLGIKLVVGEVESIDPVNSSISFGKACEKIGYDCLIFAAGSKLNIDSIPGIENVFNVDTFDAAETLRKHLRSLIASGFPTQESKTFLIVGGGFTGLEVVTTMPQKIKMYYSGKLAKFRVILLDKATELASNYSKEARQYILEQLKSLSIDLMLGDELERIDGKKVTLKSGITINTDTVIWTVGFKASPLTNCFNSRRDELNRLYVDNCLRLSAYKNIFVAGDAAKVLVDDNNYAMMSCQHAIPQGNFAGHNAVNLMFGEDLIPYSQPRYVTCLDLGPNSALLTNGWGRDVEMIGLKAKSIKQEIVTQWIYPAEDVEETIAMSVPKIRE